MKICETWILLTLFFCVYGQKYERDFEIFKSDDGSKSQSIYTIHDDGGSNDGNYEDGDEKGSQFEQLRKQRSSQLIFPTIDRNNPKITVSSYYLSPRDLKRKLRSPDKKDFEDNYSDFFNKNFNYNYHVEPQKENQQLAHYQSQPADVEQFQPSSGSGGQKKSSTDFSDFYKPSNEYERIKALSEQQAKEIQQKPGLCKTVIKDKMECQVCNDPKSGAKSESCSFASVEQPKKYAYVKEKKYNSDDDNNDEETEEAPKKPVRKSQSLRARQQRKPVKSERLTEAPQSPEQQKRIRNRFSYKKSTSDRPQRDVIGLDPYLYGGDDDERDGKSAKIKSYDDYFKHIFPDTGKSANLKEQSQQQQDYEYLPNYEDKKDVEKVLAEFNAKDRSACKKVIKGELTCYECKDAFGVQHEECMYISESTPKSSRLTYQENKRYQQPQNVEPAQTSADNNDEYYDDSSDASEIVTEKTTKSKKPKKTKITRKVVIKKRKITPENDEHFDNDDEASEKRTIKRKVSYEIQGNNEEEPAESRTVYFEHKITQSGN